MIPDRARPSAGDASDSDRAGQAGHAGEWRLWIDTGGTFTDCLALDPRGRPHRAKVLSSSALRGRVEEVEGPRTFRVAGEVGPVGGDGSLPGVCFRLLGGSDEADGLEDPEGGIPVESFDPAASRLRLAASPKKKARAGDPWELRFPEEAPILAARLITRTPLGRPLPPVVMRLATTRGTNALLERAGAPVALFLTRGFRDLLEIGTQQRAELFSLRIERPAPLYSRVVEVGERLGADGVPIEEPDLGALEVEALRLREEGLDCAAVALLNSYREPGHERRVVALLEDLGFRHVVGSAALAPLIGYLPRAQTSLVEAYLAPVVGDYLNRVSGALESRTLKVMTSAGGLVEASGFKAKDSLLSGPAGGVVAAARAGKRSGLGRVISFDMGGTSTDVARYDGDFEYLFEQRVAGVEIVAPALAIETVAAGGGSICRLDGDRLRVGPESAGASPGPACYGAGGPLTLTDVNLLLGRLDGARLAIPIERRAAEGAAEELIEKLAAARGETVGREALLEGLLRIADERMAEAIRGISVRRGYDPGEYALVAFGGAGAQHACAVAEILGIPEVLVPKDAGLLSARGLGAAVIERFAHRQILESLAVCGPRLAEVVAELAAEARTEVEGEGIEPGEIEIRRRLVNLRFEGQDAVIGVDWRDPNRGIGELEEAFLAAYESRFGYRPRDRGLEVESLRVVASSRTPETVLGEQSGADGSSAPTGQTRVYAGGRWLEAAVFEREALPPREPTPGPALIFEAHSGVWVPPGWIFETDAVGALLLVREPGER